MAAGGAARPRRGEGARGRALRKAWRGGVKEGKPRHDDAPHARWTRGRTTERLRAAAACCGRRRAEQAARRAASSGVSCHGVTRRLRGEQRTAALYEQRGKRPRYTHIHQSRHARQALKQQSTPRRRPLKNFRRRLRITRRLKHRRHDQKRQHANHLVGAQARRRQTKEHARATRQPLACGRAGAPRGSARTAARPLTSSAVSVKKASSLVAAISFSVAPRTLPGM